MPNKQAVFHYIEKLKEVLARLLTFRAHSLARLEKDTTLQWAIEMYLKTIGVFVKKYKEISSP